MVVEPGEESESELSAIEEDIRNRWPVEDVIIARRTGRIAVGELLAAVAVSSPHRQEAFAACACGIDRLKEMKSMKETEINK